MTVVIVKREPFESKTYKYVSSIEVRGNSLVVTGQYPDEEEYVMMFNKNDVIVNVNTREV